MTPKERIQAAIAHQETDICPYHLPLDAALRRRVIEFTGDDRFLDGLEEHLQPVGPAYPETNERVDADHYTDAYGVMWEESIPGEYGVVNDPILEEPSLDGYTFPPTRIPELFDEMPEQLERALDTTVAPRP